jgi:hypothetical protein
LCNRRREQHALGAAPSATPGSSRLLVLLLVRARYCPLPVRWCWCWRLWSNCDRTVVRGSSIEESGGATHFALPQPGELTSYSDDCAPFNPPNFVAGTSNGSAGQPSPVRTKEYTEHLYATERPIRYRPGACAIYRRAILRSPPPSSAPALCSSDCRPLIT